MFTDSHCHLTFPEFADDMPQIRLAMETAQVTRALCICTTLEEFERVHHLATRHYNFWATVCVHPDNEGVQEPSLEDLTQRALLPRVVAIGETGLDYYRLAGRSMADMEWQRQRFRVHILAACATGLPLVVHTRNSAADTLDILRQESPAVGSALPRGVFHCFTESMAVARAVLDAGFYISFSGIVTFKSAQELRDVAAFVPLDRMLIETDSPYLAPVPHRGRTNNPSYVPLVAQQLALVKGLDIDRVAQATSANFDQLFQRVAQ